MRYSQSPDEIRHHIAEAFAERHAFFASKETRVDRAQRGARIVSGVDKTRTPRPVNINYGLSQDTEKRVNALYEGYVADFLASCTLCCLEDAAALRLSIYGEYTPNNPLGLKP